MTENKYEYGMDEEERLYNCIMAIRESCEREIKPYMDRLIKLKSMRPVPEPIILPHGTDLSKAMLDDIRAKIPTSKIGQAADKRL